MELPCDGLNELNYSIIVSNTCGDVHDVITADFTVNNDSTVVFINYAVTVLQYVYISVCNDIGCDVSSAISIAGMYISNSRVHINDTINGTDKKFLKNTKLCLFSCPTHAHKEVSWLIAHNFIPK